MKFLENLNLYGKDLKLHIKNQEKIYTNFGNMFTIITYIIILRFAWILGTEVYYKRNPIVSTDQILSNEHPLIELNKFNFPLAFTLLDLNKKPLSDLSYIEVKLLKKYAKFDEKNGQTIISKDEEIKLELCKYEDFPNIIKADFDKSFLSIYLCPKLNSVFLEGYWDENNMNFISIVVSKCDYDSNPKFCKNEVEIDNYISEKSINLSLITTNHILSTSEYNNPIFSYVNVNNIFLHAKNKKILNLLVQNQKLISDTSFISENLEVKNFLNFEESQTDIQNIDPIKKQMIVINFFSSNISNSINRKYITIFQLFANIGGLFKILTLIFSIINIPFSHLDKIKVLLDNFELDNNLIYSNQNEIKIFPKYNVEENNDNYISKNKIEKNIKIVNHSKIKYENKEIYKCNSVPIKYGKKKSFVGDIITNFGIDMNKKNKYLPIHLLEEIKSRKFNYSCFDCIKHFLSKIFCFSSICVKYKSKKKFFEILKLGLNKYFEYTYLINNFTYIDDLKNSNEILSQKSNNSFKIFVNNENLIHKDFNENNKNPINESHLVLKN